MSSRIAAGPRQVAPPLIESELEKLWIAMPRTGGVAASASMTMRAVVANLPRQIAEREYRAIAQKTGWDEGCFSVEEVRESRGPGIRSRSLSRPIFWAGA